MKWPQVALDLLAAREVIRERGWTQEYGHPGSPRCATGAIDEIILLGRRHWPIRRLAIDAIAATVGCHPSGSSIGFWNDAKETTKAEVEAAFDEATSLVLSEANR